VAVGIIIWMNIVVIRGETSPGSSIESNVIILTGATFDSKMQPEQQWLIEFYAPWCGHCQALAPIYNMASLQLTSDKIKLGKIDCTTERDICYRFGVQGYPTIKLIHIFKSPAAFLSAPNSHTKGQFTDRSTEESLVQSKEKELDSGSVGSVYSYEGERTVEGFKTFIESGYKEVTPQHYPFPGETLSTSFFQDILTQHPYLAILAILVLVALFVAFIFVLLDTLGSDDDADTNAINNAQSTKSSISASSPQLPPASDSIRKNSETRKTK